MKTEVPIGDSGNTFVIESTKAVFALEYPNYFELNCSILDNRKNYLLDRNVSGNAADSKEYILGKLSSNIKIDLLELQRQLQNRLEEINKVIDGIDEAVETCIKIHYK